MKAILGGVLAKIPRPTPAMGVALLALLLATSGAAVAAIPSADGTIPGCRDNRSGQLRVIDAQASQTCRSTETPLSWNNGSGVVGADSQTGQRLLPLPPHPQVIASVTVTAPTAGFVIVTGSGTFSQIGLGVDREVLKHENGREDVMRAFVGTPGDVRNGTSYLIPPEAPTGQYESPFSITRMFPVTAGEHTLVLSGDALVGDGGIANPNITAIFVKNQF
jgi:hypothetical protein